MCDGESTNTVAQESGIEQKLQCNNASAGAPAAGAPAGRAAPAGVATREPAPLERLASRYGIEPVYRDAHGEMRACGADTQRALLAAMGVAADDADSIQRALQELGRLEQERTLPSVCVLWRDAVPMAVTLNLPIATGAISWRIALESGSLLEGRARFDSLHLLERHEFAGIVRERRELELRGGLPLGYHVLTVEPSCGRVALIVTPGKCWLPPEIEDGRRLWGVAVQLYLLRSAKNWGIGDYGDLRHLVTMLIARGADVLGVNPLHAMFLDDPEHASPYSPASRLLLNVLNIDVARLMESIESAEARACVGSEAFARSVQDCRDARLLDYSAVTALKLPILRVLFQASQAERGGQWQAFEKFRQGCGETFERGCLFLALREHFSGMSPSRADWHTWPPQYRDPFSAAVSQFAEERGELVTFHAWLQFVADRQLAAAAAAAQPMAVGLYRDLAVGADRSGAETWANQASVVGDVQVGAPPDIYNPKGQDWGLPPFNPRALHEEGYRSFIDLVRTNMRHAGGLRIDHVMALQRLWWVPKGRSAAEGAFVRYPMTDLIGILALESVRNRCLVVGEDLGTVPEGFRERMAEANVLSYRVLFFEQDEQGFIPPERYPPLALAVAGSHDLPTLGAWWAAADLKLKEALSLYPTPESARAARKARKRDRRALVEAFRRAGLAQGAEEAALAENGAMAIETLIRAAHAHLARSASALAMAQIDDITNETTPVNVPTTAQEHPNWRRRQSLTLEQLDADPRFRELSEILQRERVAAPARGPR